MTENTSTATQPQDLRPETVESRVASADTEANRIAETAEQVAAAAIDLGRLWARHGLTLGRLALETSAETLQTTAKLLAQVSEAAAPNPPARNPDR